MNKVILIYTVRPFNILSWIIRWALPISRFHLSRSSHVLIVDGDGYLEAAAFVGVSRRDNLDGLKVVAKIAYDVPDAEAGLAWARSQIGKPYDWGGALGLGLAPYRKWEDPASWFCYEFAAKILKESGKDCLVDTGHVTEAVLMAIKP